MNIIASLLKGDVKNVKRDIVLLAAIFAPILMALFLKFVVPVISLILLDKLSFDLSQYYPLIISVFLMLVPMLVGSMTGFILLEDKDEKMLMYYSVTPLGKVGYLFYRIISPIFISMLLSFFLVYFSGLISIGFAKLLFIILMASTETVLIALFLGAFGENRVDGLAMLKALGILMAVPVIDKLIYFKYNWALGIFPTYWVPKAIETSNIAAYFSLTIILGIVVHGVYAYLLFLRFRGRA